MHGTIASRNSTMNNGTPTGLQQPAGSHSYGRFSMNGIPGALPQLSHTGLHGQSGIANRGGLGVSQILGNSGPQITNSIGNLDGGGHIGGSFNSNGGLAMPGLGTHLNLSGLLRNQSVGLVQQNQSFSIQSEDFPALPRFKGGNADYSVDLHRNEQLHDDAMSSMQSQYSPMVRSGGFSSLGGPYSSLNHQQPQHSSSPNGSGASFLHANSQNFPQLHGSDMLPFSSASNHSQFRSSGQSTFGLRSVNSSNTASGAGSYDQLTQQYQQLLSQSQHRLQQMSPSSPYRDQDLKSAQAPQPVADQFGLLGLLNVIRVSNPDLTTLALGIDLTTLGLNLNSSDDLHKRFASPWSEEPANKEPDFSVPECYHAKQPPALKQVHFSKFLLETLFYIFYSMPKEEAQLFAANELYTRGWLYHKKLQIWLVRVANVEPLVKTDTYERGSYICFDPKTWKTVRKDNLILQYEMLEKRPALPRY